MRKAMGITIRIFAAVLGVVFVLMLCGKIPINPIVYMFPALAGVCVLIFAIRRVLGWRRKPR
jgi:hypothetical protein